MKKENTEESNNCNSKNSGQCNQQESEKEIGNCQEQKGESTIPEQKKIEEGDSSNLTSSNELAATTSNKKTVNPMVNQTVDAQRILAGSSQKLGGLYSELKGMCGISTVLSPAGRQRKREIIQHMQEIEDICIETQKGLVIGALKNRELYEKNKIFWDRLEIYNEGIMGLSKKKNEALLKLSLMCEEREDKIKSSGLRDPERIERLLGTSSNEEENLYANIEEIGIELQSKLEESQKLIQEKLLPSG